MEERNPCGPSEPSTARNPKRCSVPDPIETFFAVARGCKWALAVLAAVCLVIQVFCFGVAVGVAWR
jgi:hypothetical protein